MESLTAAGCNFVYQANQTNQRTNHAHYEGSVRELVMLLYVTLQELLLGVVTKWFMIGAVLLGCTSFMFEFESDAAWNRDFD